VGALVLSVILGRAGASTCDQAVGAIRDVQLYDGNPSLPPHSMRELHIYSTQLDQLAERSTGAQRRALRALADVAGGARENQAFHASGQLADVRHACS
jgi:hypothetical protein